MDENYMKPFDIKLRQGLVEEYFIELDLGKIENPELVTLFLAGWTYPTTVNVNVALSQDLELPLPVPPSLSVPDGRGGWKTVMPFMGFPGGKTKTIAVDLSGLLASEDSRIRIYSSMEMYWDSIFFTCGEEPAPDGDRKPRTGECEFASAGLFENRTHGRKRTGTVFLQCPAHGDHMASDAG